MTNLFNRIFISAILMLLSSFTSAATIHVKHDTTGNNNGTSWADAYTDLQMALSSATSSDEIWVAKGVYKPTTGTNSEATFQLKNGVALYGGFIGNEINRDTRNWDTNKTVLSGDIDNNDTTDTDGIITDVNNISGNNAYTVVTSRNTDNTAILDGFVITGGLANGSGINGYVGGMLNISGSPVLTNVTLTGNIGDLGGGMHNYSSNPNLTNVTFSSNTSNYDGGGMYNYSSNPNLTNVTFNNNTANNRAGGGMYNASSNPHLTNVTFNNNMASKVGGGMYNTSSNPHLTNVTFNNNITNEDGGGMYNYLLSNPHLTHVTFNNNTASHDGGGMYNNSSNPILTNVTFKDNAINHYGGGLANMNGSNSTLTNVIFYNNSAEAAGGIFNSSSNLNLTNVTINNNFVVESGSAIITHDSDLILKNVIVWGNVSNFGDSALPIVDSGDVKLLNISHSLIQNGCAFLTVACGNGIITSNPLFVDEPNGDLRLSRYSPAIDSGNTSAVTSISTDLAGTPRIFNDKVDIGAYEYDGSDLKPIGLKPTIALFAERRSINPFQDINVGLNSIPKLADFDKDGDLDAIIGESDGTVNYYENNGTAFLEKTGTTNPFYGIDVGNESSPAIIDIDNDGDLDVFFGRESGTIVYYKNTGTSSLPKFVLQNGSNNPLDNVKIDSWNSAPTFVDIDKDGDFDVFIGEAAKADMLNFYENTGTSNHPTFIKRLVTNMNYTSFAGIRFKPTFIDIDHDGDFDAFFGTLDSSADYYENTGTVRQFYFMPQIELIESPKIKQFTENTWLKRAPTFVDWDKDGDWDAFIGKKDGSINYYENLGPVNGKYFVNRSLVFKGISVGTRSVPYLLDLDKDGDFDAVISEEEGTINYYKNTGTKESPLFVEQTGNANPFDGIYIGHNGHIAFADIDADGDIDAFSGEQNGTIKYYQNIGTETSSLFKAEVDNPLHEIKINLETNSYCKPVFVDIDKDGDLDVFVVLKEDRFTDKMSYYQNEGTNKIPHFVKQTGENNPFLGRYLRENSLPTFIDFDNDNDFDVFIGDNTGNISYVKNIGSASNPKFIARMGYANPFTDVDVGNYSAPFLADLDNDSHLDALIGTMDGTILHYEYTRITNALPRGGNYNFAPNVYLKCVACDEFYYTVDDSRPTISATQYTNPIAIPADTTTTLKYISVSGGVASDVTTETYFIDTKVPTVTIMVPEDQAELASLETINGTATDVAGGIGVDYTEIQITDGSLYLAEDGSFVAEPTWLQATGIDNWVYDTSAVTFPANDYTITARTFDKLENLSAEIRVTVGIAKGFTDIYLETSATTILNTDKLNIAGKLNRFPTSEKSLTDIEINLTITAPDGTQVPLTTNTHTDTGQFEFTDISLSNEFPEMQDGAYGFQATFAGNNLLVESKSSTEAVLVGASAGYAILVHGKLQNEEGLAAHKKTTNRIYKTLKNRRFEDANIHYFNYNIADNDTLNEVIINDKATSIMAKKPTKAGIQAALTNIQTKMATTPAPLYIIMIDHGGFEGNFHIYSENNDANDDVILPVELAGWLTDFETGLKTNNASALKNPRILILGFCYSGSFISELSQPPIFTNSDDLTSLMDAGRIIITSATAQEESYKGPEEPDGVRSGEFFMEEFFARLNKGDNFKQAFEFATEKTEIFTRRGGNANATNRFYDTATQHPLLDDDGDGKGGNSLSADSDGHQAEEVVLGIGLNYDTNSADNPAEILSVSKTIYLGATETTVTLEAKVNDAASINSAPVDIRKPTTILSSSGVETSEQLEIPELARVFMSCSSANLCTETFDQFTEPGMYDAFFFVRDNETLDISPVKRSIIYKNYEGNTPPTNFGLKFPDANGKDSEDKEPKTTLLFVWQPSLDADGPVTYNLILSEDENFSTIAYQQEELTTAMAYIDEHIQVVGNEESSGLKDQTTYYWKVEAVDPFGEKTTSSEVFSFRTNNTNAPPGIGSVHISSALDFSAIGGADITLLDESGNSLPDTEMHQDQGNYNMLLPHGRRRARIQVAGYEAQEIEIDTTQGTARVNVEMIPQGGMPIQPGQLQFATSVIKIAETELMATILVERVGGSDETISVDYTTTSGTASNGSDYTNTSGTLNWINQDERAKAIELSITDDLDFEGDETLTITLSNPSGGTATYPAELGSPTQITITIVDDETAPEPMPGMLQFSASSYSATEGDTTLSLNVTRTGGSDGETSVQYMVSGSAALNSDYTGGTGILTWSDGDTTAKSLNLSLVDDNKVEESENLSLTLFNLTGDATLGTPAQATLSIADNDEAGNENGSIAGTLQFAAANYTVNEGESSTINVTRTGGSDGMVSVQYFATGESIAMANSDYSNASGTLTWADGENSAKSFTISTSDDSEVEGNEILKLTLSNPTGSASLGTPTQTTLSISDNDEAGVAGILQFAVANYTLNEGDNSTINVTRTGGSDGTVSVQYLATGDSSAIANRDYANASGTLTWVDGDSSAKSFTVSISDDSEVEEIETLKLTLANPTGSVSLGSPAQITISINDNDVATPEKPTPEVVTISNPATTPKSEPVTNPTATSEPVVTTPNPGITPNPTSPNTVTTFPTGVAGTSEAGTLQFALTTYIVNEGNNEFSGITVTRTGNSKGNVSIQYSATANSTAFFGVDYTGGFGTLTWADGDMQTQVLPLIILADDETESLETVNFVLFNPTGQASLGSQTQTTLIIVDNALFSANSTPATVANSSASTLKSPDSTTVANLNAGKLQFSAPFYPASEDMGILTTVNVIRTDGSEGEVSVQYTILDNGTAVLNSDYIGGAGKLIWANGDSSAKSIAIMLFDDRQVEDLKTIPLILNEPSGGANIGVPDRATLVVVDNDSQAQSPTEQAPTQPPVASELAPSPEKSTSDSTPTGNIYTIISSTDESESANILVLPNLGRGMAVSKDGSMLSANTLKDMADITIAFRGGASVSNQPYKASLATTPSKMVNIMGEIEVAAAHIGQEADILVVAGVLDDVSEAISLFLMVDEQERLQVWNGEFASLVGSQENIVLAKIQTIEIYQGLIVPVWAQIYFGYRLKESGSVYFNGEQPIEVSSKK